MVKPVVIQTSNYVDQSTYQYRFPTGSIKVVDGDSVALAQASMFYSFYNIGTQYRNTTFTYYWYDLAHPYGVINAGNTYTVTYPDGFYNLNFPNAINTYQEYFEKAMIANGTYLLDATGEYVFYFEILWNATYGKAQIVSYPLPTALPVGWSLPVGATWALPAVATCPVLDISSTSSNVPTLLGIDAGLYPPIFQGTTYSILGTRETNFYPVTSVIVSCNILKNVYSSPPTNLYTIPIQQYGFGDAISVNLGEYAYVNLVPGIYDSFEIRLLDQNYQPLLMNDKDIIVYLLFQTKADLNV